MKSIFPALMVDQSSTQSIPCPSCGTPGSGRFCAECGAVLQGAMCGACRSILAPGARFCHRCGAAVATATAASSVPSPGARAPTNYLPWAVVGLAATVLLVILAAQRSGVAAPPSGIAESPDGSGQTVVAAPDISSMSPRERANRLFNRIMQLAAQGKQDSVQFFAPMAVTTYESLGPLDADLHYDYGRIAEVSGDLDLAAAQSDSILAKSPQHLLGLILAARVADARGDRRRRDALERQLLSAESSERNKGLDEYDSHKLEIDAAVAAARGRAK